MCSDPPCFSHDLPPKAATAVLLCLLAGCAVPSHSRYDAPTSPGASRAWVAYEAEDARTNAAVHGPGRKPLSPEAEASGRRYVRLAARGDYVEVTARKSANFIVVRACIPDSPSGGGKKNSLSLYLNGNYTGTLSLDSRFAWIYGDFPWSNDPSKGRPHRFFDESHATLPQINAGDVIRLQYDERDGAGDVLLDFIELEQTPPPLDRPLGSLCLTDFGAVTDDGRDDAEALRRGLSAARTAGKTLWIPRGVFQLEGPRIPAGGVRLQGAGLWHTTLSGPAAKFEGTGERLEVSDLAIFGDVAHRDDQSPDNAFNGNFGFDSVFRNLWIEHVKCGFWTTQGTTEMRVEGCRIRNTMADGLNFCDGTSRSVVEQCHLRNTGDDALATWSPTGDWSSKKPCEGNQFSHNTVETPWLANGIALYGGTDHKIAGNLIVGTVQSGGGILVSSGFEAVPFAGIVRITNNVIRDAGGECYIGETVGGLWIYAKDSDITTPVVISKLWIEGGIGAGLTLHGPKKIQQLELNDVSVRGAGGSGIEIKAKARGAAHLTGFQTTHCGGDAVQNATEGDFAVRAGSARKEPEPCR